MIDSEIIANVRNTIIRLIKRYREYETLIRYPGDWGERALRFWIIKELFMDHLHWRVENIVFGERYDVLLVDEHIRPRIYVETKRPGIRITERHIREAIDRARDFYSIDYVVVTNGITWILYDCIKGDIYEIEDIRKAVRGRILDFFNKIHAMNYIRLGHNR